MLTAKRWLTGTCVALVLGLLCAVGVMQTYAVNNHQHEVSGECLAIEGYNLYADEGHNFINYYVPNNKLLMLDDNVIRTDDATQAGWDRLHNRVSNVSECHTH